MKIESYNNFYLPLSLMVVAGLAIFVAIETIEHLHAPALKFSLLALDLTAASFAGGLIVRNFLAKRREAKAAIAIQRFVRKAFRNRKAFDLFLQEHYHVYGTVTSIRKARVVCCGENHFNPFHRRLNGFVIDRNYQEEGEIVLTEDRNVTENEWAARGEIPRSATSQLSGVKKKVRFGYWDDPIKAAAQPYIDSYYELDGIVKNFPKTLFGAFSLVRKYKECFSESDFRKIELLRSYFVPSSDETIFEREIHAGIYRKRLQNYLEVLNPGIGKLSDKEIYEYIKDPRRYLVDDWFLYLNFCFSIDAVTESFVEFVKGKFIAMQGTAEIAMNLEIDKAFPKRNQTMTREFKRELKKPHRTRVWGLGGSAHFACLDGYSYNVHAAVIKFQRSLRHTPHLILIPKE